MTLRAEEVGTQKSCINIDHIEADRWGVPLVDADWHAFCHSIYKAIEDSEWEELYDHFPKSLCFQTFIRLPHSRCRTYFFVMRAARDRGEDFYDPARADNIMGWNKTRLDLLEEHLKDPMAALDKAMSCLEYPQ